jgi:catechol 2,3-dioxygenase-like lactoylglutathione lyase family enzyme
MPSTLAARGDIEMIDHVSIAVRDLAASARFYEPVLATLGQSKLVARPGTVGFGKKYPEFWLNERRAMTPVDADSGTHICLRAPDPAAVDAFHAAALVAGGTSDGAPGPRPEYTPGYYAAFVRDPDGNRIEAVTFVTPSR